MATPFTPALSRSWKLKLDGGEHIVELEYTLFDMAIARVDGQTVGRTWKFWRVASSGADFPFRVAGHELIGTIRPIADARRFHYELFLDRSTRRWQESTTLVETDGVGRGPEPPCQRADAHGRTLDIEATLMSSAGSS